VKLDRRFYGCELKDEYYETAQINLAKAQASKQKQFALFGSDQ